MPRECKECRDGSIECGKKEYLCQQNFVFFRFGHGHVASGLGNLSTVVDLEVGLPADCDLEDIRSLEELVEYLKIRVVPRWPVIPGWGPGPTPYSPELIDAADGGGGSGSGSDDVLV